MITQERFDEIEGEHGCGYWFVCFEHDCPCAIVTENKGLQENIYINLQEYAREVAEQYEPEWFEMDDEFDEEPEEDWDSIDCDTVEGGCGCCPYDEPICAKYFETPNE